MNKVLDYLALFVEGTVAALFVTIFLVTMLNIVLRNIGGIAWLWIPAVSRLVFIWLVFLGIAAVYRRADHLTVDFFLMKLKDRARIWALIGINLVLLPFFWILVSFGWEIAQVRMRIPFDTWPLPTGFAYMAVPVAGALLLVFCVERLLGLLGQLRARGATADSTT